MKNNMLWIMVAICVLFSSIAMLPQTVYASAKDDFVIENGVLKQYKGNGGKVTIPDGVVTIGQAAFYNNNKVTEIIVPKSVKRCETGCFALCGSLKSITFLNKKTQVNHDTIENKVQWEEGAFYPGKYMDGETYPAYKKIAKSTLTIKGYANSTAQTLAKKLVTYPYGYKAVKFVNISNRKTTTYGIKVKSSLSIKKGKTATIKVTLPSGLKKVTKNPGFTSNGKWYSKVVVKYKSSNPKIATVDSKGKVTAKKKGTAKITVTVSWGKDNVIMNNMGDIYTYSKTFTTKVTVK